VHDSEARTWRRPTSRGAHLQGAKLRDAHFERADLGPDSELGLPGANLEGALIKGANFSGAKLQGARFTGAEPDKATVWPAGFDADAEVGSPGADQPT
jgi:uncharacterized protein YjbI with pentapeptide repeats